MRPLALASKLLSASDELVRWCVDELRDMDSLDSFRTAVGLHRVRIAQEADQHIAQFLSLDQHTQRAEPTQPCARPATAVKEQHLRKALAQIPESSQRLLASRGREPVMDAAAVRWWSTAAQRSQRCSRDRGAAVPRDRSVANAPNVQWVEGSVTDAKALDKRAAALTDVQRCRRVLHRLHTYGEARSRATLIAQRTFGLLQLRRACGVWRSHQQLAAALHATAGELQARARAEQRRLGCRRGLDELLRFAWRARHVAWHVASMAKLLHVLQRRRDDRALGRGLRHWQRIASTSARDRLPRCKDATLLTRPHRPPLAPLVSAHNVPTHNVPTIKKTAPGPKRPVSKKMPPCMPYGDGDGQEMLCLEAGPPSSAMIARGLPPRPQLPPYRSTVHTQNLSRRPSQIPIPKSTLRVYR